MAGTCNYIILLFFGQIDKFNGITGYTNRKVCVFFFFRMFLCIQQFFFSKYIDIQVMCSLIEVSVKYLNQIVLTLILIMSQCVRINRLRIGNSIQSPVIWEFSNGVQGSKQTILLCSVTW